MFNTARHQWQSGFTLVELLISMLLGLMVVGMMISLYTSSVVNNSKIINQGKLNLEVKSLIELMSRDIRRAGYWADATSSALSTGLMTFTISTNYFPKTTQNCLKCLKNQYSL